MGKIRINDLARELEVKSKAVLDYLPELGITDKRSHSSAVEEDVAEKVREHFRAATQEATVEEVPAVSKPAPVAAAPAPVPPPGKKPAEVHHEVRPLTRTLAEIKADARRVVAPPPPLPPPPRPAPVLERPGVKVTPPAAGPVAPPAVRPPSARPVPIPAAAPAKPGEIPVGPARAAHGVAAKGAPAAERTVPLKGLPTAPPPLPAGRRAPGGVPAGWILLPVNPFTHPPSCPGGFRRGHCRRADRASHVLCIRRRCGPGRPVPLVASRRPACGLRCRTRA